MTENIVSIGAGKMRMNLQHFATFDPDTVTLQAAKTGSIPKNIAEEIIVGAKNGSAMMKLAKAVPMTKPIEEFTYMSGVGAYWVNETERIETSKPKFVKAEMQAHKLAVIIPTSKENLKHSISNFFELMRPEIEEAFHKKFDQATFSGGDSPYAFNILKSATAADNLVDGTGNKYDDLNEAMGLVEEADLDPNAIATSRQQKRVYRGTKDQNGLPIFNATGSDSPDDLLGLPLAYSYKGAYGEDIQEIVADWDKAYYGVLDGIEYEILTEATLTTVADENGNNLSLAERDMAALKATFSLGFMVVKDEAFAIIRPAAEGTGETSNADGTPEV